MPKQIDKPTEPTAPTDEEARQPRDEQPWRPRMETPHVLHGFPNVNQEPDPLTESPNITDPNEDTTPLQGSLDHSDEDSLVDEYRASDKQHRDAGRGSKGKGKD